ncbi:PREDICTED: serine/threonine-protein kinase haspin homolog isoform X2 [Lupinus angustifolius]|uniref:serine/threonine-protein kinase haspin homolog isoform X2 n=1 Tax=Lupinus angustifolius TaxID=3871 RepID=UPI00092EF1B3|nr:PREDICTED: serine/threonine-protein kinase haspin homolog isoform X2 [Lupinus angustifolius]
MISNSKAIESSSHSRSEGRSTTTTTTSKDLWSEIIADETQRRYHQQPQPQIDVVYQRRKPRNNLNDANSKQFDPNPPRPIRVSLVDPNKRVSWNRALSTRGRTSIAVGACMVYQPQSKKDNRKGKPALPKGKFVKPPNFDNERLYFQEVDAFDLMEESPSPKKAGMWLVGNSEEEAQLPPLCSRLEKWLYSRQLNPGYSSSTPLFRILETPSTISGTSHDVNFSASNLRTLERTGVNNSQLDKIKYDEDREHIEAAVKKLSLTSTSSLVDDDHINPFAALLAICGQYAPLMLQDAFSSDSETVVKIGEGTFGEAFKVGKYVCKIVPFDGDLRVNGEVQKRSEELMEEVLLCKTLNQLRGNVGDSNNVCKTFIESIEFRVCQGPYCGALLGAWEDWDDKHGSENDHPKEFPEKQCYVVFVQEHGGKDLESFVLLNFDEARTLLVQVTAGLAVAESAYEFEHRDLHWGNILISRSDSVKLQFTLDGKDIFVKTYGLLVSIIDFTLSRINTGDRILYLDLSSDPDLFKGPKGDKQSETYRRMKEVTEDWWEGSFPKTNVLWLHYLVDILLLKKSFERSSKNERDLRSLKKRLDKYNSAKEAINDPFFSDLIVENDN